MGLAKAPQRQFPVSGNCGTLCPGLMSGVRLVDTFPIGPIAKLAPVNPDLLMNSRRSTGDLLPVPPHDDNGYVTLSRASCPVNPQRDQPAGEEIWLREVLGSLRLLRDRLPVRCLVGPV